MAFDPIVRQSASGAVFEQISARVLGGELAAGDSLPSERHLAQVLGVSRPAVREALQKLSHAGLVEVRQGDSTSVRDFRRHGGPELLPSLLIRGGQPDWAVVRSVLEARAMIGAQVARLVATRSGPELTEQLRDTVRALGADDDPVGRQRHALNFWECVVDGADSLAFRLIFNSLRQAYEPTMAALGEVMKAEVGQTDAYLRLADAIAAHDEDAAERAAVELLELGTTAISTVIDNLEGTS
ncbi:FadR/GntR family transcriptional regulator [Rhodococcus daqingensis]|uniref:FadR/GntR family transcriptional regulator n=1 Tax=Rhodococcus daqingensis TaxID=2479363 RepID=A0ABW2RSP5_9NOCA